MVDRITDVMISGQDTVMDGLIEQGLGLWIGVQPPIYHHAEDGCTPRGQRWLRPTPSGIEASQHFIDRVVARHCLPSGYTWSTACGTYTPKLTSPFELDGYPTYDKSLWDRMRSNIQDFGCAIGDDFSHQTWRNEQNNPYWSGDSYLCTMDEYGQYPQSGQHPIISGSHDYGGILREDFNTFICQGGETSTNLKGQTSFTRQIFVSASGEPFGDTLAYSNSDSVVYTPASNHLRPSGTATIGPISFKTSSGIYNSPSGIVVITSGYTIWDPRDTGELWSQGPITYEVEVEFYTGGGTVNLWPLYEYAYNFGGDLGSASGALGNATHDPFDWAVGEYLGSGPGYSKMVLSQGGYSSEGWFLKQPSGPDEITSMILGNHTKAPACTYGKVRKNRMTASVGHSDKKICYVMPLEGKCGNRMSFRNRTGVIVSGDMLTSISMGTPDNNRATVALSEYIQGYLGDRSIKESDYVFPNFRMHGDTFPDASSWISYLEGREFNEWFSVDDFEYIYTSGYSFPSPVSNVLADYHQWYDGAVKSGRSHSIPTEYFGCDNSGNDRFLSMVFDYDHTAVSGEIKSKTDNVVVNYPNFARHRLKFNTTKVTPVVRHSFFGSSSYSGVIDPEPFSTPWTDWIYQSMSPNQSGMGVTNLFNVNYDFEFFSSSMGNQTRVAEPVLHRLTNSFEVIGGASGIPGVQDFLFMGNGIIPIEPAELMYSGDTPTNYYLI